MKRSIALIASLALLAGCTGAAGSAAPTASPATPPPSPAASQSPGPSASAEPEPSEGLAEFECDLPLSMAATTPRAQITDVRVATHGTQEAGYDRIVFEFDGNGTPEVALRAGTPPFTFDPSGLPLPVRGTAFLVLVLQGATGITPDGVETYAGPTEFTTDFPALTEFKQAGDFEAVSEWVAGLTYPACHRVFVLQNPSRLVIDLQHLQG